MDPFRVSADLSFEASRERSRCHSEIEINQKSRESPVAPSSFIPGGLQDLTGLEGHSVSAYGVQLRDLLN
jgi:hypothetical protein